MIVVATDEEYKLAKKRYKRHIIIKTGVGGINVIHTLKHLPKWLKITNLGIVVVIIYQLELKLMLVIVNYIILMLNI